jgi:hypothetical protein
MQQAAHALDVIDFSRLKTVCRQHNSDKHCAALMTQNSISNNLCCHAPGNTPALGRDRFLPAESNPSTAQHPQALCSTDDTTELQHQQQRVPRTFAAVRQETHPLLT